MNVLTLVPRWLAIPVQLLFLAACGGGSSDAPTPLPTSLSVSAPATRQAINADIAFASNPADATNKLTYRWEFGDGATSAQPTPTHRYARSGTYTVRLTLTNEAAASVQASAVVTVADLALTQGKLCSGANSGGWCWQNPLPQGNSITDVAWADDLVGWVVGDRGTILKTTDGGATWVAQASGTDTMLVAVAAVDVNVVWIAGERGLVLRSTDGGATWRGFATGVDLNVASISALNTNVAWVANETGTAVTGDGGTTWRRIVGPSFGQLAQTSLTRVWTVNHWVSHVELQHSSDAGQTWTTAPGLPALEPGFSRNIERLRFASEQQGVFTITDSGFDSQSQFVTRVVTLTTSDGGASWATVAPRVLPVFFAPDPKIARDGAIFIADAGGIFSTVDRGVTWRALTVPPSSQPGGDVIQPFSATRVALRGYDGTRSVTSNGGTSWKTIEAGGVLRNRVTALWLFDSREGLASLEFGGLLRTSNGGQSWTQDTQASLQFHGDSRLQFTGDGSLGWLLSTNVGNIWRSTDRGKTWLAPVQPSSALMGGVRDFHFVDSTHGWAVAPFSFANQSAVFATTNGGLSWQSLNGASAITDMESIRFADRSNGVAVGEAGVAWITSDGGATWRARPTGSNAAMARVTFVDALIAVAVGDGGAILRSTNRGDTWSSVRSPTAQALTDVRFINTRIGYAVGRKGTVLITRDAGLNWTDVSVRISTTLLGAFFLDESTGWVHGENGTILTTVAGGQP
jgi:photosystem II stability/assembly factor-like uncharacterized protein